MSRFLKQIAVLLLALLVSACATLDERRDGRAFGRLWIGELTPSERPEEKFLYRLDLRGKQPAEWIWDDELERWTASYPGMFRVVSYKSNAFIYTTQHDQVDGDWVETRIALFTWIDDNRVLLQWNRMVNNVNQDADAQDSKFSFSAKGILHAEE